MKRYPAVTAVSELTLDIDGMVLVGEVGFALSYAIGALAAGVAYCALFLLLAVVTRNARGHRVVLRADLGVTDRRVGSGGQTLSVQQWWLALTERLLGSGAAGLGIDSATDLAAAVSLLIVVAVGCTGYAGQRLRSLRLSEES